MNVALHAFNGLLGLGSLVCAILVLIRLYNAKGTSEMLLGLFCTIFLFIWGWQNAVRLGFTRETNAWKLCLLAQVVVIILFVVAGMLGAGA